MLELSIYLSQTGLNTGILSVFQSSLSCSLRCSHRTGQAALGRRDDLSLGPRLQELRLKRCGLARGSKGFMGRRLRW